MLEDAENLQFADSVLREKVAKALSAIQSNRAADARTLEISTRGQGTRAVRVAYIVSEYMAQGSLADLRRTLTATCVSTCVSTWASFCSLP